MPFWGINGSYHDWSKLPPGYSIDLSDFTLIINNVTIAMNGTRYSCVVEGVESEIAFLYVLSNITEAALLTVTTATTQGT